MPTDAEWERYYEETSSWMYTEEECCFCHEKYMAKDRKFHSCVPHLLKRIERIEGMLGLTPLKRGDE